METVGAAERRLSGLAVYLAGSGAERGQTAADLHQRRIDWRAQAGLPESDGVGGPRLQHCFAAVGDGVPAISTAASIRENADWRQAGVPTLARQEKRS
ncbi:hypothetical protein D3C80_1970830 [compost metagenome]